MRKDIHESINEAISLAPGSYSRLIMLVGPSGSGKTRVLQEISSQKDTKILNVNLEMSKTLMELPIQRRESRASRVFNEIIQDFMSQSVEDNQIVLLDNLEILFDKDLKLDPLVLLQGVARNTIIITSWNGTYRDKCLTFARVGHPEYRFYDKIDAQIIEVNKEN